MESIEQSTTLSAKVDGRQGCPSVRSTWPELTFRALFSVIFIVAGVGHLFRSAVFVERMQHGPVGQLVASLAPAELLVVGTGVVLLAAGVGLLVGYRTRMAALMLIAVLVPVTVSAHVGVAGDPGPLLQNVALLGGLLHYAAVGATGPSLDRRRCQRDARAARRT